MVEVLVSFKDAWIGAFNAFRSSYPTMSFDQAREFTESVVKVFPEQKRYNLDAFNDFFGNHLDDTPLTIFELGGYNGQLACEMLLTRPNITSWINLEMCQVQQVCFEQRYLYKSLDDWPWEVDNEVIQNCNTFVSSHVIEHMSFAHFERLIAWLPSGTQNIYIDAPLSNNRRNNWGNYLGTHVMEQSWIDVQQHMERSGFYLWYMTPTGRAFKRLENEQS